MSFSDFHRYDANEFYTGKGDRLGKKENMTVCKCHHNDLDWVVVKVFKRRLNLFGILPKDENEGFRIMLHEAEKIKMFDHENIIRLYGVLKWPGFGGIALEIAECGDLGGFLGSTVYVPDIPWWLRQRMLLELFQALRYLHNYSDTKSVAHGNVSSRNILLTRKLTVKLSNIQGTRDISEGGDVFENRIHVLESPEHQKLLDIYSASHVAYEIITRRILTAAEYGYLTSLGHRATNFAQLEENLGGNDVDISIFNKMKDTVIKCGSTNEAERPDANAAFRMLSQGNLDFYGEKSSEEALFIAKQYSYYQPQMASVKKPLDVAFRAKTKEDPKEVTQYPFLHTLNEDNSRPTFCSPIPANSKLPTWSSANCNP
ncbi:receptor-interacting serine/threonine-protein kinase 2-like isoform X1 [Clavelina lepadiformis]|uniref:receptor-interacting serine/threonine-protein kinase 2-like isoform X1 n=1 Tax=Clavelina lepadiformis TaxID=159417 RepID=UPI00404273F6